jgi:hypothetical protein
VISVKTELALQGALFGVPITGKIDLLAELPGGRYAIIDLKWSGAAMYRGRLETGTHLQLAIYSALIEQNLGRAPVELAFYVVEGRALLTTTDQHFPRAESCLTPPGSSVNELLTRAEASWNWRNGQLAAGLLEVVDTRLDELSAFQGPAGTLPVEEGGPWNAEYVALLGWQVQA